MRLCDLREKEVINTVNCRRLGCVADLVVDRKKAVSRRLLYRVLEDWEACLDMTVNM